DRFLDLRLGRVARDPEHHLVALGRVGRLLGDDGRENNVVVARISRAHLNRASNASTAALVSTSLVRRRMSLTLMPLIGSTSMLGRLRAASLRPASISAPSMISALSSPSLEKLALSALVLPPSTAALSITTMPPSLALAESACLSASARTFLGRSIAWLRTTGPNERPPPRNRLARADPWRAPPVAFWAYIFLPVRPTSARFCTPWGPAPRLASCP